MADTSATAPATNDQTTKSAAASRRGTVAPVEDIKKPLNFNPPVADAKDAADDVIDPITGKSRKSTTLSTELTDPADEVIDPLTGKPKKPTPQTTGLTDAITGKPKRSATGYNGLPDDPIASSNSRAQTTASLSPDAALAPSRRGSTLPVDEPLPDIEKGVNSRVGTETKPVGGLKQLTKSPWFKRTLAALTCMSLLALLLTISAMTAHTKSLQLVGGGDLRPFWCFVNETGDFTAEDYTKHDPNRHSLTVYLWTTMMNWKLAVWPLLINVILRAAFQAFVLLRTMRSARGVKVPKAAGKVGDVEDLPPSQVDAGHAKGRPKTSGAGGLLGRLPKTGLNASKLERLDTMLWLLHIATLLIVFPLMLIKRPDKAGEMPFPWEICSPSTLLPTPSLPPRPVSTRIDIPLGPTDNIDALLAM